MLRYLLSASFTIFSIAIISAQDFQGMAVYESKTSTGQFSSSLSGNKEITPDMQKMIEERMKKMFEKTFILYFDKTASLYEEEEKLDAPGSEGAARGSRMMAAFTGGGGKHYKNLKTKSFRIEKEMMGKEFLVKDSLPKLAWKMTGESKQIGSYTCFKATATQATAKTDFRNFVPKPNSDAKKETAEKEKPKATNFFNQGDMPTEIEVTAWYTPDIPVGHGPENFYGLPGLILEVTAGKTTMLCSKVVLNPKDRKEIKEPTKGKEVTQTEFDEIVMKKMEEMQQMYQNRGGNPIKIGG